MKLCFSSDNLVLEFQAKTTKQYLVSSLCFNAEKQVHKEFVVFHSLNFHSNMFDISAASLVCRLTSRAIFFASITFIQEIPNEQL